MKFLHTADLHIGKRVCERSLLEDQKYVLNQILEIAKSERPDGILIAGDVYDKSIPAAEAVEVLDEFLFRLSELKIPTFVLSGNHDSAERIAFGGRLLEHSGVYMSPVYSGSITPITLRDELGEVDVWMLPFVRPSEVRSKLGTDEDAEAERAMVKDYTSAVRMAISKMDLKPGRRNVLVAHQFVTGAETSESEEHVGGLDNIDVSVFDAFDYVALGHIHKPQNVSKNADEVGRVRYSGTPLKYSLSEALHQKSVSIVEIGEAGNSPKETKLSIQEIPLKPLHDVRKIEGFFDDIVKPEFRALQKTDDYVYIVLNDETDREDAAAKLRGYYPNLMMLTYNNSRTRNEVKLDYENVEKKKPLEIVSDFFKEMNGREMSDEERDFVGNLVSDIWGE